MGDIDRKVLVFFFFLSKQLTLHSVKLTPGSDTNTDSAEVQKQKHNSVISSQRLQ